MSTESRTADDITRQVVKELPSPWPKNGRKLAEARRRRYRQIVEEEGLTECEACQRLLGFGEGRSDDEGCSLCDDCYEAIQ